MEEIRNIRDMSVRRRQWSLTVLERVTELDMWTIILALLMVAAILQAYHLEKILLNALPLTESVCRNCKAW